MMRLINRPPPVALESLESYLARLGQANHYEKPSWFQELLPLPHRQRSNLLRAAQDYQAMRELTGLSLETLKTLTLHRFAPQYYLPEEQANLPVEAGDLDMPMWEPQGLGRYVHGQPAWKLCPQCWQAHKALLLPWSLRHVTTCPTHQILLVDHCSTCDTQLHLDPIRGCCARCGEQLGNLPTLSMSNHQASRLLTWLVWDRMLFNADLGESEFPSLGNEHPLRQMAAPDLFRFFWWWGHLLARRDPQHPFFGPPHLLPGTSWDLPPQELRQADVAAVHNVLLAILTLFLSWSEHWHETIDRLARAEEAGTFGRTHFPQLLTQEFVGPRWDWLWKSWLRYVEHQAQERPLVSTWVRALFLRDQSAARHPSAHAATEQQRIRDRQTTWLSQRAAARTLQVGERQVQQYLDVGLLQSPSPIQHGRGHWRLVSTKSALRAAQELQSRRARTLTLNQAAQMCGVSEEQMISLIRAGLIRAEQGPLIDQTPTWKIPRDQLQTFLQTILTAVPLESSERARSEQRLSLTEVLRLLSTARVHLPQLLRAIQQGLLPAYRVPDMANLDGLQVRLAAAHAYLKQLQQARREGELTLSELGQQFNCKPRTIQHWQEAGLLLPCREEVRGGKVQRWYRERDVQIFLARYIAVQEATTLLGCTAQTVQRWVKSGRLIAVTGPGIDGSHSYRFEKATLVQWRQERMTFGEAASLLGISKATLHRWVEQGKIKPLEGMGGKQRWFSRQMLLLWKKPT